MTVEKLSRKEMGTGCYMAPNIVVGECFKCGGPIVSKVSQIKKNKRLPAGSICTGCEHPKQSKFLTWIKESRK